MYSKAGLASFALLLGVSAMAAPSPFTVDDMWSMQRIGAPVASPDGRLVAFTVSHTDMQANKSLTDLWLQPLSGTGSAKRLTTHDAAENHPQWSADGKHLYFLSSRSGSNQVWRIAIDGGEAEQISRYPLDVSGYKLSPSDTQILVSFEVFADCDTLACTADRNKKAADSKVSGKLYDKLFVRHWDTWKNGQISRLYWDRLEDGKPRHAPTAVSTLDADVPSKPFGGEEEYSFSPDGEHIYFNARIKGVSESWSTNHDIYQYDLARGELKNLTPDMPGTDITPIVSPDGKKLAWLSMARAGFEADKLRIMVRDLRTGETIDVSEKIDRSFGGLQWSADSKTLFATANDLGQHSLFALNVANKSWKHLVNKGYVGGFALAGNEIVYSYDTLKAPAELYRVKQSGGSSKALTSFNQEKLATVQMGDYEQFSFKGWNDETVYGYVVKPAQFDASKKYPVAFLVHGGPQGSFGDHFHYRWNPQVYAGQGYVAIMIDFHGSTGYGQAFTDSISQDWGGKPLEDLKKGWAEATKKYAFIDEQRACALGASYGGYMMNWIAGQWADGFRCIVNHAGIFDTRSMYYTTEELWFVEWENGGPQFNAVETYEKHNPMNHVKNWRTPMLVTHGLKDYRVPYSQGIAAFTALQRLGVPSQLLIYPDENHWLLKPQNNRDWHQHVLKWLDYWTKPE